MVYLTHSASDPTPQPQMAHPENSEGDGAVAHQILVAIGGTLACMMTVCIVVTFTRCCCRRRKDESSDEEPDQEYGHPPQAGATVSRESSAAGNYAHVITELQSHQVKNEDSENEESLRGEDPNALSVKDRIRAFETQGQQTAMPVDVRMRDTPKRKKPKSKAFEDFESQGILIGFGAVPRDKLPHGSLDEFPRDNAFDLETDLDAIRRAHSVEISQYMEGNRVKLRESTRSRPPPSSLAVDDDFAAVQRNSAILKSFRRAPPPKNRNRARRSDHRKQRQRGEQHGDMPDTDMPGKPPVHPGPTEEENFEQSLHMPSEQPQRRSQYNGSTDPYNPSQNGHSSSDGDSDISDAYNYYQPRRRSLSESGRLAPRDRAKKTVTYYSTQGLSHDPIEVQRSEYEVEPPSGEGPVSFDTPPHLPHLHVDNRYYSSPHVRMSPQCQSPESPPAMMRKWGSDAVRTPFPTASQQDAYGDREGPHVQSKPNTERLERKFRNSPGEEERVYPKSEKLSRKPLRHPSDFTPPHLLYRPFYQSKASESTTHHYPPPYVEHEMYPVNGASSDYSSRMIVQFKIDTEPTNV